MTTGINEMQNTGWASLIQDFEIENVPKSDTFEG